MSNLICANDLHDLNLSEFMEDLDYDNISPSDDKRKARNRASAALSRKRKRCEMEQCQTQIRELHENIDNLKKQVISLHTEQLILRLLCDQHGLKIDESNILTYNLPDWTSL